jgi:hypothetical protein
MELLAALDDLVVGHMALLLAHQGGWDEILMVLAPVSIFAGLLYVANRRAKGLAERGPSDPDAPRTPPPAPRNHRAGPR